MAVTTEPRTYGKLPVLFLAAMVFCICYAGAMITALSVEKSRHYELDATIKEGVRIQESDLRSLHQIKGVEAVTPIHPITVTVGRDEIETSLKVYGIRGNYMDPKSVKGEVFLDRGAMPQLILNQSAL